MALTDTTRDHNQSARPGLMDDSTLIAAARDDAAAFDGLYRRYVTRIYRYCYSRTENAAVAEDLTAQTFLAALEGIGSFHGDGSVAAWLFASPPTCARATTITTNATRKRHWKQ